MLVRIPDLLSPGDVAHFREALAGAAWTDGKVTAGSQSAGVKKNLLLTEASPSARSLGEHILGALG
jgi:PKHD-type hydroxylase